MGLFDIFKKNSKNVKEVWRNVNGQIVCPGDACPKECDNSCPIFLNTIAISMMQIGESEKALEVYEEILEMAPDFYDVYNNMAGIYGGQGQYQKAYDCYMKAHELNGLRPNPVYGLALCCRDLNRPEEAIKWCEEYNRIAMDNALAELYSEMKTKLGEDIAEEKANTDVDYEIVKKGEEWSIVLKDNAYFFIDEDREYATTPRGTLLETTYQELAERILNDLETFGPDDFSADSILPWHYTYVENFSKMEHKKIEDVLVDSFVNRHDWTYTVDVSGEIWEELWGRRGVREREIMEWLGKISPMQMTAACCIGNAYHTINIAYMLANLMETYKGDELDNKFEELSVFIEDNSDWCASVDDFKTFELYYGLHLKENGNVINR